MIWRMNDLLLHPAHLGLPSPTVPPWLWNPLAGLRRIWCGRKRQSSMALLAGLPSPSLFQLLLYVSVPVALSMLIASILLP